ncbi:HNH endonuclease signature motif containing protein [Micromonospora zamorensis]|uniref:HNH endonuclease n=1 Tax=Micromonospora zamorensis TaxID=709883 RepID=UPI0012FD79BD
MLHRDKETCTIKAKGCTVRATHVDHIVPREMGGTEEMDNLRAACEHCNLSRKRARVEPEPAPKRVSSW